MSEEYDWYCKDCYEEFATKREADWHEEMAQHGLWKKYGITILIPILLILCLAYYLLRPMPHTTAKVGCLAETYKEYFYDAR